MAFVTIRIKGSEGYTRVALGKERMVLGRSSENDVPIKHTSISREHCVFLRVGDDWFIEDMGSSNGTWVGKTKVAGKTPLKERDIVKTGKARLTFHLGDMSEPEVAVDLSSQDDEDDAGESDAEDAPRERGAHEPPNAMACSQCAGWMSVAHRHSGDRMDCPRCGHTNAVISA